MKLKTENETHDKVPHNCYKLASSYNTFFYFMLVYIGLSLILYDNDIQIIKP